ncbi:MAG: hypothetical protein LUH19_08485 [Lachnospiraceae bacterium]|nr:hypothetical protein [Lachnospiraceae bacterium]
MIKKIHVKVHPEELIAFLILFMYLWVLLVLQDFPASYTTNFLSIALCGILSLFITALLFHALKKLALVKISGTATAGRRNTLIGISCVFIATFLIMIFYFLGEYTEDIYSAGSDILNQYSQALGNYPLNNWHPFLHTLLFYIIPVRLTNSAAAIVILQLLYFSLAFTYLIYVIFQNGGSKFFILGFCVYIWLNPFLTAWMVYPTKDVAMMIFVMVLMAYYIQIICSRGMWLHRRRNLFLFSLFAVLCCYMRHNAILFVAPLVLIALFYDLKNDRQTIKMKLTAVFLMLALSLLIRGIYAVYDVENPSYRTIETIGLPISVWANVLQSNADALPAETREVLLELLPQDMVALFSADAGFNSIKFLDGMDWEPLDALSYTEVLKYTVQCFRYAPRESIAAVTKLTNFVWSFNISDTPKNYYMVTTAASETVSRLVMQLKVSFGSGLLASVFGAYGLQMLIILIAAAVLMAAGRTSFLHILPVFCYNYGTMLLLTGRDYRFFLFNIPLWMCVIFLMLKDEKKMRK